MDNDIIRLVVTLLVALVVFIVAGPLSRLVRLPLGFVLIALGFLGSEALVAQGVDTGIRWTNFHDLIFYVFLPALIFNAAFRMNFEKFIENLFPILMLAAPLLFVAIAVAAAVIHPLIGSPEGFPWIAALLAAVLIAPTDPVAVGSVEQRRPLPARLKSLIEGESLLNDATALILFVVILSLALAATSGEAAEVTYGDAVFNFLLAFFGGGTLGALIAIPGCLLLGRLRDTNAQVTVTFACAYGTYIIANYGIGVSGIMAVLVCGLMMGAYARKDADEDEGIALDRIWSFLAYISESMIFLLAGVTITVALFTEQWLAMLIGVAAAVVSRAVVVYGSFPLFNLTTYRAAPVRLPEQSAVALGGVRGALTMALALSLPTALDYWFTVQAIAYGAVLFTLLVQAGALEELAGRLKE